MKAIKLGIKNAVRIINIGARKAYLISDKKPSEIALVLVIIIPSVGVS